MEHFVARQPIFDRNLKLYAYELLFRSGLANYFSHEDGDQASSRIIANSILLFGIEDMTGGARAFINFTRQLLVNDYALAMPRDWVVIEVLENIRPDEAVVHACRKISGHGFTLALDDFVYRPAYEPLLKLADIVKVDFMDADVETRRRLAEDLIPRGIRLLAEKVETQEDFREALDLGYTYFQGYFFSRPLIVSRKDVAAFKLQYLRILKEVNAPEMDFDKLAMMIGTEASLSYKLLKYINSAAMGLRSRITSIKQALHFLGEKEIKKWVSLVSLAEMASDKPDELIVASLVRARFAEQVSGECSLDGLASDMFLTGLFSMLDAIVDRPLDEIMASIPVDEEIKEALLHQKGRMYPPLALIRFIERGDWDNLSGWAQKACIPERRLPLIYSEAIQWARRMLAPE